MNILGLKLVTGEEIISQLPTTKKNIIFHPPLLRSEDFSSSLINMYQKGDTVTFLIELVICLRNLLMCRM